MSEAVVEEEVREGYKRVQVGPTDIEIPSEWRHPYFDEVIEPNPTYDKPDRETFDFVPMDAVSEEGQRITYLTERDADDCTTTWFENGDTIYPRITPCTENGKIAFVEGIETGLASGSTEFTVFHPKEGETDPRFVFYLSNLQQFRAVTISLMQGSTGRQRVPNDIFEGNLRVPTPPVPEQRRIAAVLSTVDEQIRETEETIETAEELKQGLTQDLFSEGADQHDLREVRIGPRSVKIPAEWTLTKIDDLASESTDKKAIRGGPPGGKIKKDERAPNGAKLYVQENVIYDDFEMGEDYLSREMYEDLKSAKVDPGDVLITRSGTIGRSKVFPESAQRGILGSSLIRIKVDRDRVRPEYLSQYIDDSHMAWAQVEAMSHGGTRTGLNNKIVKSIQVPLPSLEEQDRIIEYLEAVDEKIQRERKHKKRLQELKHGLMQDLLTGQIRTPPDLLEDDTPPSSPREQ